MAEAMYQHMARGHQAHWNTFNLVTNMTQDKCRVYLGGCLAAYSNDLMDNSSNSHIVKCTQRLQRCGHAA
jgi:hypothetical protein